MRVFVLLTLILTESACAPASAQSLDRPVDSTTPDNRQTRVRSHDARVLDALVAGAAGSAAFREVLARVEAGDVIVYIEMQPRLRGKLAGVMTWVAATTQARYVRVALNPEFSGARLVAVLAHELEHVAEIGAAPSVVSERTLSAFYREVGSRRSGDTEAWDTEAARLTGEVVRKELAAGDIVADQEPVLVSRTFTGRQ
jgi:hypothetical protein